MQTTEGIKVAEFIEGNEFFNNNPLPMWVYCTTRKQFFDVNAAAVNHYGYSKNEFLALAPTTFFQQILVTDSTRENETINQQAFIHTKKNNETIVVLVSETYIPYNGKPAIISIITDITAQKQSDETILFQAGLIDNVSDIIVSSDSDFKIKSWNKAAEKFYGYSAAEVLGKHFNEFVNYEYSRVSREIAVEQLNKNGFWNGEVIYKRKDGIKSYLSTSVSIIKSDKGDNIGLVAINRDITHLKKVQQHIEESEAKFRFLSEYSQDLICLHDADGNFVYVSPSAFILTGYTAEELIGRNPNEFFHPEDLEEIIRPAFNKTLSLPVSLNTEYRFRHKAGHYIWFESVSKPFMDADGTVLKIQTNTRDITNKKLSAIHLTKKEEEFRTLTQNLPLILHRIDKSLRFTFANKAYEKAFNKPAQMIVGKTMQQAGVPKSIQKLILPLLKKVFQLSIKKSISIEFPTNDGGQRYFLTNIAPEKDAEGNVVSALIISSDITAIKISERELKNKEEELTRSNERYMLAVKAANDAIWEWDIQANELYWGEGFKNIFGYASGYKMNNYEFWEANIHPKDRKRVLDGINVFLKNQSEELWMEEYRFKKSNGNYALVVDKGYLVINDKGESIRMIGAMEDVTEKKALEKKVLKNEINKQKLVAQAMVNTQEKERAEIGKELHDNINQILSTAKLFLELAKTEEANRLELINKSSDHILNAINEIRTISKSLVPPSISDLGLSESIKDLVANISVSKSIKIKCDINETVDVIANDKLQLMLFRIIQEQVNNVLKHANAKNLTIQLKADTAEIILKIKDNGIGFDPELAKNKKGVGLSNIISRAELFGGKVKINSKPGSGCILKVVVPNNP